MVAGSILAIFAIGAFYALAQISTMIYDTRDRAAALSLAWSRLERLRNSDFGDIPEMVEASPGTRVDMFGAPVDTGNFLRTTQVTTSSNSLSMHRIRIEVRIGNRRTGAFTTAPEALETVITDIPLEAAGP